MYANNFEQLNSFFIFMIVGIIISVLFDLFRILRKAIKTSDMVTYIQDILFWILAGIIILYSIFTFNNGALRLYIFIGMFIGILIYMILISKYVVWIGSFTIKFTIRIITRIIHILMIPFYLTKNLLKKIFFRPISFIFINIKSFTTKMINKFKKIKILNKKTDKKEGIY